MKKTIYLCFCAFLSFKGIAQQTPLGYYAWTQSVKMTPCRLDGKGEGEKILSLPGQKFSAIERVDDGKNMIIRVLDYKKYSLNYFIYNKDTANIRVLDYKKNLLNYFIYNKDTANIRLLDYKNILLYFIYNKDTAKKIVEIEQKFFKVSQSDIQEVAQNRNRIATSLSVGVINFPMKLRIQRGGDWESSFNFGAGAGLTFRHRAYRTFKHSIITGYSNSTVGLDSATVSSNHDKLKDFKDFQAFSFSLGYLVQYESIQAGIFFGFDHLRKSAQQMFSWKFQSRPWVSIGIGVAIFTKEKKSAKEDQKITND